LGEEHNSSDIRLFQLLIRQTHVPLQSEHA